MQCLVVKECVLSMAETSALGGMRENAASADPAVGEKSEKLADNAYERILDAVLSGEFPPGTPLQERRLSEILQVSRTPVREALGRLEAEGIIGRQGKRYLFVRDISVREIVEVLFVRELLETKAVELAAKKISRGAVAELRKRADALLADETRSYADHLRFDNLLHDTIADASGVAVLAEKIRELRRRTLMFNIKRIPERYQPVLDEHFAILDALDHGDVEAATAATRVHINNIKQSIISKLSDI